MRSVRQVGKTLHRFKAGTRLTRNAVSPAEYAMQELGALGGTGRAAEPARRGVLATLKADGGPAYWTIWAGHNPSTLPIRAMHAWGLTAEPYARPTA
jgi:hypothetical protein